MDIRPEQCEDSETARKFDKSMFLLHSDSLVRLANTVKSSQGASMHSPDHLSSNDAITVPYKIKPKNCPDVSLGFENWSARDDMEHNCIK